MDTCPVFQGRVSTPQGGYMHSLFFHMLSSIHPNLLGVIGAAAGTFRLLVANEDS